MTFDNAARARIARGWQDSPLDQRAYATQNGISERTLRDWVRRFGIGDRPVARAKTIIDSAIAQLQAFRTALDADEEHLFDRTDGPDEERHAAAAEAAGPAAATAVASPVTPAGVLEPVKARDAEKVSQSGATPSPRASVPEAPRHADAAGEARPDVRSEVPTQASCEVAAPRRRPGGFFAQPENWV